MEYSLYALYYLFQSFFNMLMEVEVADGVPVGGLLIGCMILRFVLMNFSFGGFKSGVDDKLTKKVEKEYDDFEFRIGF